MDTSQGIRICLKLIHNIQGRADDIVSKIDEELAGQIQDEQITTLLEYTSKLLTIILDDLDNLETTITSMSFVDEGLDPAPTPPSHGTVKSDMFTADLKQQFMDLLPELYEYIQEFVSDQFDNINEVKYMIQICCNSSDEKYNTAVEMIEIIESHFDQMEEFFSPEGDDSGIAEKESCDSYESETNDSEVCRSDLYENDNNDFKVKNWMRKHDEHDDSALDYSSFASSDDSYFTPPEIPHTVPDIPSTTPDNLVRRNVDKKINPTKKDGTPDLRYKANREHSKDGAHLKKDGTPDKRYKENKPILLKKGETRVHLKKDGTPDRRYNENKQATKSLTSANRSATKGPLKKDGTPDLRYSSNKLPLTSTPEKKTTSRSTALKKDGTPDMRFAVNKCSSTSTKSTSSTPLKKDGTPDMRYAANKNNSTSSYSDSVSSYGGGSTSGLLKKDGTPDMRFTANKSISSVSSSGSVSSYGGGSTSGPLKKDGTPDMRCAANKSSGSSSTYSSGSSSYGGSSGYYGSSRSSSSSSYYSGGSSYGGSSSSSSSYCPGPTTKSGAPDMRYAANKAYFS